MTKQTQMPKTRIVRLTDEQARLLEHLLNKDPLIATPRPEGAIYRSTRRALLPAIVDNVK